MPLAVEHGYAAIAVAKSSNEKIGDAATTYAAQGSCPTTCVFFNGGGCYAENGRMYSGVTRPLNLVAEAAGLTPLQIAEEEAAAIDALNVVPGRPMRLHTVGDCRTDAAARVIADACDRYCMDDTALLGRGHVIGFAVHGTASVVKLAVKALRDPDDPTRRLTSRDYAYTFRGERGRWPTIRELAGLASVNRASAQEMLERLRREDAANPEITSDASG